MQPPAPSDLPQRSILGRGSLPRANGRLRWAWPVSGLPPQGPLAPSPSDESSYWGFLNKGVCPLVLSQSPAKPAWPHCRTLAACLRQKASIHRHVCVPWTSHPFPRQLQPTVPQQGPQVGAGRLAQRSACEGTQTSAPPGPGFGGVGCCTVTQLSTHGGLVSAFSVSSGQLVSGQVSYTQNIPAWKTHSAGGTAPLEPQGRGRVTGLPSP